MNKFDTIRKACKPIRMTAGIALIALGAYTGNAWFYLGILPFIAGATNFCPLCMITKKCSI
jgi:hypothetical protein